MLNISSMDTIVIPTETHLGIEKNFFNLPVIVQSAIAIIIDAKNSRKMSLKLHKINMERSNAVIDSQ